SQDALPALAASPDAAVPGPPRPPCPTLFPYTALFRSAPPRRWGRRAGRASGTPMSGRAPADPARLWNQRASPGCAGPGGSRTTRSEEHTSELQSREKLVCRLLLEKNNAGVTATSSDTD